MTGVKRVLICGLVIAVTTGCVSSGDSTTTSNTANDTSGPTSDAPFEGVVVGVHSEGSFAQLDPSGPYTVGQGSGLVISHDGLILTAATSVVGAERINVYLTGQDFPLEAELDSAAECANLALVRVDHEFESVAEFSGDEPTEISTADKEVLVSGWTSFRNVRDSYLLSDGVSPNDGAAAFDSQGRVAGVVNSWSSFGLPLALRGDLVESWVRQMRSRDVVGQLGFSTIEDAEGRLVVAGVGGSGVGSAMAFAVADIITKVDNRDLTGGIDQLCQALDDGSASIEVERDGQRFVGGFPDQALRAASLRTTEQIRQAVIKVVADSVSGSGFFISEDGYAVTNYHVAGSSQSVNLRFDNSDELIPARVVGASACADIAVLKADGGPYEFLEWAPGPAVLEEPVRVVGFPNSTETISFQEGSVAKEDATGAPWGGFLPNFESSAQTDGGNSGGPVVNEFGEVLGVVYSAHPGSLEGLWESHHLAGIAVQEVVDGILSGTAPTDPGFMPDYRDWSASEATGNPIPIQRVNPNGLAETLGLKDGDLIDFFGALDLPTNLTGFEMICNRLHDPNAPVVVDITVWRPSSGSLWDGQINGQPLANRPAPFRVTTADETVKSIVPGHWKALREIDEAGNDKIGFFAALDLGRYSNEFGRAPGMRLMWSWEIARQVSTIDYLAGLRYAGRLGDAEAFENDRFRGHYQRFDFGGSAAIEYALGRKGDPASPMVMLFVVDAAHRVEETARLVLDSIQFNPPPP